MAYLSIFFNLFFLAKEKKGLVGEGLSVHLSLACLFNSLASIPTVCLDPHYGCLGELVNACFLTITPKGSRMEAPNL